MYDYRAKILRVIDGDTVDVRVDLGFCVYKDRQEKYGRYLATLFVGDVNINDRMVLDGHAVEAHY